ncbi:N/A [soil metagenome]
MLNKRRALHFSVPMSMTLIAAALMNTAMAQSAGSEPSAPTAPAAPTVSSTAPASKAPAAELERVVVSADKRPGDIQKAGLAISSVSEATLEQAHIVNPDGLNGYVPGLMLQKAGPERLVSIRGVGSQTPETLTQQPGVSFHIDGIYVANTIALQMGFLDVERIEVLRGPQGTVFGQSSTGGTINVINVAPQLGQFSGDFRGSYGNYDLAEGRFRVNVPLGESFALRAAYEKSSHDGFAKITGVNDYGVDDSSTQNGRVALLWQATPDLVATLNFQEFKANQHAAAQKNINDPIDDPRTITQDFPGKTNIDLKMYSLLVDWNTPFGALRSSTSFQDLDNKMSYDSDRSDFATVRSYRTIALWNTDSKTWTQELTLTAKPLDNVDVIAGAFYLASDVKEFILSYAGSVQGAPTPILTTTRPAVLPSNLVFSNYSIINRRSWSPFFQSTLHVSDALRLVGGARYNHDSYSGSASGLYSNPPSPRDSKDNNWTGKVAVEFDASPESMEYFSVTRGYKPGGVNTAVASIAVPTTIKSEKVDTFELGSKNRLLDNHLRLNADVFFSNYRDMQYIQEDPVPNQHGIFNVPKAQIWGLEAEAEYLMGYGLKFGGNFAALDGRFPDDFTALDKSAATNAGTAATAAGITPNTPAWYAARAAVGQDIKGNIPPMLSHFTATANASHTLGLNNGATLLSRVEYQYRGSYYSRVFNDPVREAVPSYGVWNLFFQYQAPADWDVALTVTNLFDRNGVNNRAPAAYAANIAYTQYIPPRQVLATFGYHF